MAAVAALGLMATPALVRPASGVGGTYDPYFATPTTIESFPGATNPRPFGVAVGDYDEDGDLDIVSGRVLGQVSLSRGNGDGTFGQQTQFPWKQTAFNAMAFAPADVNGDGHLDVVWGANATTSTGCTVSPIPSTGCPSSLTVTDGEVRAFLGNGNGTFAEQPYFVSGVRHNAGVLLADVGDDAGSLAAGDLDADGDVDLVVGSNQGVSLLLNTGGAFTTSSLSTAGIAWPATAAQNSPWGLALGDVDADGDLDLWVGDRAQYIYLLHNDGTGAFTLKDDNTRLPTRPTVYLAWNSAPPVGYTPSLASADFNGDGRDDLAMSFFSGAQTPATNVAHDGEVRLGVSTPTGHALSGAVADLGAVARGLSAADINADGAVDLVAGDYSALRALRQLPPLDSDADGVSDYVDNAPLVANAARLDLNTDGSFNAADQLDNDFDTVLGNPEDASTWVRLGDPIDPDDDNDGVPDDTDNCPLTANADQADRDLGSEALVRGDACDPLDDRDPDGDGVPTGPRPGDALYELARDASATWSKGDTHFVIRIDALGRFFQNEFTQLMTDAATLAPVEWEQKCWENYGPGDPPEQCGTGEGTAEQTLTLAGGKEVPISLVTIPRLLWTDPPVIDWVNDRNNSARFDLAQHATYHASNTGLGDWTSLSDRNFYSCELCGFTTQEGKELLQVGRDTLLGNYANRWLVDSGATPTSPRIDWSDAAIPLLSYSPPFNADDTNGRAAAAALGFRAYSSSIYEENSPIFTPEGSHFEQFDQFGMFHASADLQLDPPVTSNGAYDPQAYAQRLDNATQPGGLNTWLIEEVEWSGRPCNDDPRTGPNFTDVPATCTPDPSDTNRENNTVYQPRWDAWLQLLDHVRNYPGGVAMTMAEVALAKGFDNAPTVPNPDQADSDHDGIGDVVDDAALVAAEGLGLTRGTQGSLQATLTGQPGALSGQQVTFGFDADGDGTDETYTGTTDAQGVATALVTAVRPVGTASYTATWSDGVATATDTAQVAIGDVATLTLDAANPITGQATDSVVLGATLVDTDGVGIPGFQLTFTVGQASAVGTTDANGHATATVDLAGPAGAQGVTATFAGGGGYGPSSDTGAFQVSHEDTLLALSAEPALRNGVVLVATLTEDDGGVAGRTITFTTIQKVKGKQVTQVMGTALTDASGEARLAMPAKYLSGTERPVTATFAGGSTFLGSEGHATVSR